MTVLKFDIDDLTLEELVLIEDKVGESAMATLASGQVSAKAMTAVVWIIHRREDPEYAYEDALKVRVVDLDFQVPSVEGG